jgi:hypothetical protein
MQKKSLMTKSVPNNTGGMKKSPTITVPKHQWGHERKSLIIKSAQIKLGGMKEFQKDLSVPQKSLI